MWRTPFMPSCFVCTTVLATIFLGLGRSIPLQAVPQNAISSTPAEDLYFPPGPVDAPNGFFSSYLRSVGEPSLLAVSHDSNGISYRFESLSGETGRVLTIRLSANPDGSALVHTTEASSTSREPHKTEGKVATTDVRKFLELVENAGFWSMSTMELQNTDTGRKAYKMDANTWVFEGVRNGNYHVVLRRGLEPSPFTDMVRFLAKDIAKLEDSSMPRPYRPPEPLATKTTKNP